MIKFNETTKTYGNKRVLKKLSFEINEGDFVLLVGKNGCGKSTILKLLSGNIHPDKLNMVYKPKYAAYLPEKLTLPKNIKVSKYIELLEEIYNFDIYNLYNYLEIPDKLIGELSKGNLQKLGLITLISANKNLLILDEPTEGMDDVAKAKMVDLLKGLNKAKKTIIISTHDVRDYKRISNKKIFYIEDGKLN